MKVLKTIQKLEKSKEYSSWKKIHAKSYLVHVFRMFDDANKGIWQIGYFNPETNLISVFIVGDAITKNPDAEVFKEQEKLVNKLDTTKIKVDEDAAMKAGELVLAENYKGVSVFKSFMILQNLDEIGQVWNITFVTQQFKTVNVKIDAKDGKCISHKLISLISEEH